MQENTWARLRESSMHQYASHPTQPTYRVSVHVMPEPFLKKNFDICIGESEQEVNLASNHERERESLLRRNVSPSD